MYCSKCGQQCDDGASYCKNCGYFLRQGAPPRGGVVSAKKNRKKRSGSLSIVWQGLALAMALAAVLALVLWLTGVFDARQGLAGSWTCDDGSVSLVFDDSGFVDIHEDAFAATGAYTFDPASGQAAIFYERGGEAVVEEFVVQADSFEIEGRRYRRE